MKNFKMIPLTLFCAGVLLFAGCAKDADEPVSPAKPAAAEQGMVPKGGGGTVGPLTDPCSPRINFYESIVLAKNPTSISPYNVVRITSTFLPFPSGVTCRIYRNVPTGTSFSYTYSLPTGPASSTFDYSLPYPDYLSFTTPVGFEVWYRGCKYIDTSY